MKCQHVLHSCSLLIMTMCSDTIMYTMHQHPVCVKIPMCVLLRQAVDLTLTCRDKFVEFSYLRSADKKHGIPEHLEKTVLFLVDASPVAKANADSQDWDAQASSAKAAEEEAAAAVKAAWHAAKEAKEVLDSSCHLSCACDCPWNLVPDRFSHFTCSLPCVSQAGQQCNWHALVIYSSFSHCGCCWSCWAAELLSELVCSNVVRRKA